MPTYVFRRIRSAPVDASAGFTLVEVMAAMVVFALVAAGAAALLLNNVGIGRDTQARTQAASVGAQQLEIIRNQAASKCAWTGTTPCPVPTLPAIGSTTMTKTVGVNTFTIKQTTAWMAKAAPAGSCDAPTQGGASTVQPVLLVTEKVSSPAMLGSKKSVRVATELTPPPGAYSTTTGGISVKVLDSQNNPVSGVPITVSSGGSTTSLVTNDDGCTFAAYLAAGSYTVTANQSGYVDNQEVPTSVQTIGVTTGNVSTATFFYDQGATVNVSFSTPGNLPSATGLPVTVYNSGISGLGTYSFPGGTTSLSPLYPYTYGVWAGHCPEADPNAVNNTNAFLYTGPPARTSVATSPAQTASVTVPLYPLTVTVKNSSNVVVPGATVTLTEVAGGAKTACSGFNTYNLTTANSSGVSATGVPLGHFTVKATSGAKTGTANVFVTPSGTSATVTVS